MSTIKLSVLAGVQGAQQDLRFESSRSERNSKLLCMFQMRDIVLYLLCQIVFFSFMQLISFMLHRLQPTRRTSWKLVANPGFQLVSN